MSVNEWSTSDRGRLCRNLNMMQRSWLTRVQNCLSVIQCKIEKGGLLRLRPIITASKTKFHPLSKRRDNNSYKATQSPKRIPGCRSCDLGMRIWSRYKPTVFHFFTHRYSSVSWNLSWLGLELESMWHGSTVGHCACTLIHTHKDLVWRLSTQTGAKLRITPRTLEPWGSNSTCWATASLCTIIIM